MADQSLKNKKIIISAGASGIGLATAKVCLSRGATVYLCDLNEKFINKLKKHPLKNKKLFSYECDASNENQVSIFFKQVSKKTKKIDALINTYRQGKIDREGASVAIVGKPNVGKSSLLNALLRENRAIVTSYPGTTRDTLEEKVFIKIGKDKIIAIPEDEYFDRIIISHCLEHILSPEDFIFQMMKKVFIVLVLIEHGRSGYRRKFFKKVVYVVNFKIFYVKNYTHN